jgi:hypothetical protein
MIAFVVFELDGEIDRRADLRRLRELLGAVLRKIELCESFGRLDQRAFDVPFRADVVRDDLAAECARLRLLLRHLPRCECTGDAGAVEPPGGRRARLRHVA